MGAVCASAADANHVNHKGAGAVEDVDALVSPTLIWQESSPFGIGRNHGHAPSPIEGSPSSPNSSTSSPNGSSTGQMAEGGGGRVRLVTVVGAGLEEVNGEYEPCDRFLGAERFVKASPLGSIYIRRLAVEDLDTWVITLSEADPDAKGNLYLREDAPEDRDTPPLFGWDPCEKADGVPDHLLDKLGSAPQKLEYYHVKASSPPTSPQSVASRTSKLLQVGIFGAACLPWSEPGEKGEAHCVFRIPSKPKSGIIKTLPVPYSDRPEWGFASPVEDFAEGDELDFSVYRGNRLLGQATLRKRDYHPFGFVGDFPLRLASGKLAGDATISLCVTLPDREAPGIRVKVDKRAGPVGLSIAPEGSKDALSIRKILKGGLVHQWNQSNPRRQVRIRDRVVEVNKRRGTCLELLAELEASEGEAELLVRRKMST